MVICFNLNKIFHNLHLSSFVFHVVYINLQDENLFQVPTLENQISTVEKYWQMDLYKFEKRKCGHGEPWLVALDNQRLRESSFSPPASSIIRMYPLFNSILLSALAIHHLKHPITTVLHYKVRTTHIKASLRMLKHLVQKLTMTFDARTECVLWAPEASGLHQRQFSDCCVTDRQQMLQLFLHILRTICPPSELREETVGPGALF